MIGNLSLNKMPSEEKMSVFITQLCKVNYDRKSTVKKIMEDWGIKYTANRSFDDEKVANDYIRVAFSELPPDIIIGAHFDAYEGSCGANDNASGVSILLNLACFINSLCKPLPIELVFFDKEEKGRFGSKEYISHNRLNKEVFMINLDTCGVGNCILISEGNILMDWHKSLLKKAINNYTNNYLNNSNLHIYLNDKLPVSDDSSFVEAGFSAASICTIDFIEKDTFTQLMNKQSLTLKDKLRLAGLNIVKTMHNGKFDKVDVVDMISLRMVYEFVKEFLTCYVDHREL